MRFKKSSQIKLQYVAMNNADMGIGLKHLFKNRKKSPVYFYSSYLASCLSQLFGQCSNPGTDFQGTLGGIKISSRYDFTKNVLINQKVLTQALLK
ncbi:hypothetical protein D3C73_1189310 [compost metagenome]